MGGRRARVGGRWRVRGGEGAEGGRGARGARGAAAAGLHARPEPRLLVHRARVDCERVGAGAHHLAAGAVGELDLHVVVHLVHAPQPVRLRVHHQRPGAASGKRLEGAGGHSSQHEVVATGAHVAVHAHPDHDARLPELVAGPRHDVTHEEDAVGQLQVSRELCLELVIGSPPHPRRARRQLAFQPRVLLVVDDVIVDVAVLVAAVGGTLHHPDVAIRVHDEIVGEDHLSAAIHRRHAARASNITAGKRAGGPRDRGRVGGPAVGAEAV